MNIKEIERLIEKYYEGETSTMEEQELRDFFQNNEVPEHLALHKPVFSYFSDEKGIELEDPGFETRMDARLSEVPVIRNIAWRTSVYTLTAVAASLIILVGVIFNFRQDLTRSQTGSIPSVSSGDQMTAYIEARQTLNFVSARFNTGINEVRHLQAFDKGLEQMNRLSTFYQYQSLIINPDEFENPSSNPK